MRDLARYNNWFDDNDFFFKRDLMKSDIKELDNGYEFDIEMPGYQKEDIKISVNDGSILIQGEVKKEVKENEKYVRRERYYGQVSRSYYIGEGLKAEDIKASFKDGVLTLIVNKPKKEIPEKKYISIE